MDIKKFILENLKNKNGKLEGQRLTEKWFTKHNFLDEYLFFSKNNILDSRSLYLFISNDSELCECGNIKRYIGFEKGFQKYCETCARTKNNYMKKQGNIELALEEIPNFVKTKQEKYNTTKIKQLSINTISSIIKRTNYLSKETSLTERIYHIEHKLFKLPKCKLCGKEHNNFYSSIEGYRDYCKGYCSRIYNLDDRKLGLKRHHYSKFQETFKSDDNYKIEMFSFEDYVSNNDCQIKFKHLSCGHEYERSSYYQGHYKCPKCYPVRSKIQYEIYEWLKETTNCTFNDRQFIKPKEIDILTNTFGIEYDSLMFHSFGNSSYNVFDNIIENKKCHLEKTELCEQNGIQLFRIFSNEWINKQEIWKSVINSKLGTVIKIFARKCTIQELDSKTTRDFLNKNHLQGEINSSIRIGLYYNEELVSVMTFGKTRRNKWKGNNHYELYRFCTKLNTQVIGGASKLLKYFERNFKPELIVSYANRRWSQGQLYDILGFEFIENTVPNYFYFKGGDSSNLESREKFQKHKLEKLLPKFNPELTETENMFNHGFRKIYDSGNKVYIKKY